MSDERGANELEIKNAIIESVSMRTDEHGLLMIWVQLNYGGFGQGFGGYCLYLPKKFQHHELKSFAGHFIWRLMEIADVTDWNKITGKTIRVKANHFNVQAIGHIVNDDWFDPEQDFKGV